jgi:hypothetical protein
MLIRELIMEDLGTLASLNVGPLINILKQEGHASTRKGRDYVHTGPVGKKFSYSFYIGAGSVVTDFIPLPKGIASLRKAYKIAEEAGNNPRAFALYINQQAVAMGIYDYDDLRGSSRYGKLAYDLTPFAEDIAQIDAEANKNRPSYNYQQQTKVTSYRKEPPSEYDIPRYYDKSKEERAAALAKMKPKIYQGQIASTSEAIQIIETIESIAKKIGGKLSAKLVYINKVAQEIRRKRQYSRAEIKDFKEDLKKRLIFYKNSKKPTANTIHEFLDMILKGKAKAIQFAGITYNVTPSTLESKIDPLSILRGATFNIGYHSQDPGVYDSLYVTYSYDSETNLLLPIKARWTDKNKTEYSEKSQEAILDAKGYLRDELGTRTLEKGSVIKGLIQQIRGGYYKKTINLISALKQYGIDWPELDTILRSATAELANKK